MIAAQYGDVSDIEVVWTLIALAGFLLSIYNVRHAQRDRVWLRNLHADPNGRGKIATTQLCLELSRGVVQLIFVTIGVLAMLVPDARQTDLPLVYVLLGAFFRWGLIVSASLITWQSYLNYRLRVTLAEIYSRPQPSEEPPPTSL